MQKLKQLAFNLSNTNDTRSLKKLYPTLDFRRKDSWQLVIDELQLRNITDNSMTILSLQSQYDNLINQWYKVGKDDEYYLDSCDKLQRQIKSLEKDNVIYFPNRRKVI